jgi:hypothetical protein
LQTSAPSALLGEYVVLLTLALSTFLEPHFSKTKTQQQKNAICSLLVAF